MGKRHALAIGLRILLGVSSMAIAACGGATTTTSRPPVAPSSVPTATPTPSIFIAGHLYVSQASVESPGNILRYTLHDGIPGTEPDLVYQGSFFPAFFVQPAGSLYAFDFEGGPFVLDSFAPNSPTPATMLTLPTLYGTYYTAVTTDARGYVYAENTYGGTVRWPDEHATGPAPRSLASSGCTPSLEPYAGMLVYAPDATGSQGPIRCFYTANSLQYNSIAVDSRGTLYVPQSSSHQATIAEIGTPRTHPHVIRTLRSPSLNSIGGIAIDAQDRLWVLSSSSSVLNFAPYASGSAHPDGKLTSPGKQQWSGNVAVDDKYLYIGADREVLVYDKTATGKKEPLATLSVNTSSSVGAGPFVAVSK